MTEFFRPGRQISGSKTCPKGHVCVFNANVVTAGKRKVWFGDLDLTADKDALSKYAIGLGEDIYVLREKDARFASEANPNLDLAVASITASGVFTLLDDMR
jgi:hypothetical protein